MIEFKPYIRHAAHYNIHIENMTMERIIDLGYSGYLLRIHSWDDDQNPDKKVVQTPGLLIENLYIDTATSSNLIWLEPSVPTVVDNLTVKNHLDYNGYIETSRYAAWSTSPILMVYGDNLGDSMRDHNDAKFWVSKVPNYTVYATYKYRPEFSDGRSDDNLKPADSLKFENLVFETCNVLSRVFFTHEDASKIIDVRRVTITDSKCFDNEGES